MAVFVALDVPKKDTGRYRQEKRLQPHGIYNERILSKRKVVFTCGAVGLKPEKRWHERPTFRKYSTIRRTGCLRTKTTVIAKGHPKLRPVAGILRVPTCKFVRTPPHVVGSIVPCVPRAPGRHQVTAGTTRARNSRSNAPIYPIPRL